MEECSSPTLCHQSIENFAPNNHRTTTPPTDTSSTPINSDIQVEAQKTMEIGKAYGIQLQNHEALIIKTIQGERPEFDDLIFKENENFNYQGPPESRFFEKLKYFKRVIKMWVRNNKLKEVELEESLHQEMEQIDKKMEISSISEDEEWVLLECKKSLLELEAFKSKDLWQKSRVKWASLGDDNTSFFHGIINSRNVKNKIHGIEVEDVWIQNPKIIKREIEISLMAP
ncbi:hypothetical protein QVD17_17005 [Tagetes erecta]|uniref:Uncharacterized protein n=1 Tax=Tagetes erecta TaxID=13708 RepID=A0AAD8P118_TARER|nr:hypothetical protein QVD17_17005 [Tagetes erecta]